MAKKSKIVDNILIFAKFVSANRFIHTYLYHDTRGMFLACSPAFLQQIHSFWRRWTDPNHDKINDTIKMASLPYVASSIGVLSPVRTNSRRSTNPRNLCIYWWQFVWADNKALVSNVAHGEEHFLQGSLLPVWAAMARAQPS